MNPKESMIQGLHAATRPLLSAAILGFLSSAASAAPAGTTTVYGTTAASTSGTNYPGGTILGSNTVRLDDGAVVSGTAIVNDGTLDFNQSAGLLLTISNTISGNGTLNLSNSGTLQLSGTAPSTRFIPLNMTINANSGSLITPIVNGTQNGIIQLGQSGTGTLNVAGGYVTSNNLLVGQGNGVGTINVSSGTLRPTAFLTLGGTGGGSGTLNVTGGVVGGSGVGDMGNGIYLGRTGSSSGLITITGGTVGTLADLRIGELGSGTVSLANGYLRANNTNVGSGTTSVGLLSVTSGTADLRGFLSLGGTSSGAGRGTLTVDGGVIAVRGGSLGAAAGTLGTVTVTSGTWLNNASGIGSNTSTPANLTIGGSGTGSVTINNGGYVVVSGTLSRGANGTLTLNQGGTLQIGGISKNENATRFMVASTGTTGSGTSGVLVGDLNFAGTLKFAQNGNVESPTSTHNGTLSGSGDLVKTGTGTLLIGGNNSYTGGTTLTAGVVSLNSANAIGTTGTISFGGGTLQATTNNTTDYSSRFSNAADQKYAIDSNGENLTLASDLTSVGGMFTKSGAGTVTLTGANTFTSGTIQAGVLEGSAASLATSGTFGTGGLTELRFNQTTDGSWGGKLFGTGTASKYGAGTLTLSGSGGGNTGTLSIVEGAVRVSTDSIKRNVVNDSQLTFDQTTSGTYSGIISGNGNMQLTNSGTITFSGTNALSGTATVSGGRLIATRAAAMPSQVVNNAAVAFNNAVSGTYGGNISGSGLLAKLGAGDMTLTGANSYSGGTQVSAGSLIGDTTSLQGNVAVSGGNLKFNQATHGTFSAALSGVGNFFKLGAGDLTLAGTNTNAGPWNVSAGRLIGTSQSVRGDITNSAAVVFDQTTSGTYLGNMSGAGTLTKLGVGDLVLSGSNTFSGGTTLGGGTLALGSANALGSAGTIGFNGGSLQSSESNTADYSARFSNAANQAYRIDTNGQTVTLASNLTSSDGTFTKLGAGSAILGGSNSYTGATTVSGGSLVVNGSLDNTSVTVRTGAQLGGSGTIGSGSGTTVSIESGGSLSPGNSPGTLTINGSLILSPGSTFNYEMVGGGVLADSIDVNGFLDLGGASLSLTNLGSYTVNQKFTVLAYDTMVGSFAGLANNAIFSGAGGTWKINYNDTSGGVNAGAAGASYVTLTAVSSIPEPRSVLVGGLLLAGLFLRQRRTRGL